MVDESPLLSLVVPFHAPQKGQRAAMLEELLGDGVGIPGVEYVLVDDGSPIAWSPNADPALLLHLVRLERNLGPGGARNAGLASAQGRWVLCVDSDDRLDPSALRAMVEHLATLGEGVDVVTFPVSSFVHGTDELGTRHAAANRTTHRMAQEPEGALSHVVMLGNKVFRSAFLQAHALRLPPLTFGEDLAFLGMVAGARPVCLVWQGAPLVRIREGHESLTQAPVSLARLEDEFRAVVLANVALSSAGLGYWRWSTLRRWCAVCGRSPRRAMILAHLLFQRGAVGWPDSRRVWVFLRRRWSRWTRTPYAPGFANTVQVWSPTKGDV